MKTLLYWVCLILSTKFYFTLTEDLENFDELVKQTFIYWERKQLSVLSFSGRWRGIFIFWVHKLWLIDDWLLNVLREMLKTLLKRNLINMLYSRLEHLMACIRCQGIFNFLLLKKPFSPFFFCLVAHPVQYIPVVSCLPPSLSTFSLIPHLSDDTCIHTASAKIYSAS